MSLTTFLAIVAGCFGVAMGASPLLQAFRAHRRRSAADVSLSFLLVLFAGGLAWLLYGLAIRNPAIIICNSVGVVSSSTSFLLAWRWREVTPEA